MPAPLDMANIAALDTITQSHLAEASKAGEAIEAAHQQVEQFLAQRAQQAGGRS